MTATYTFIDHTFDVVVVGAGGAGLRATLGCSRKGTAHRQYHQGLPDAQPHRRGAGRHLGLARQHGPGRLDAGTCTTRSRAPTGSATRTRSNISAARRPKPSTSLSISACRSAAPTMARSISAPSAAMTSNFGEGIAGAAHMCRRRPHRPCDAAHALRPVGAPQGAILYRIFRHRPDHGCGRPMPRRRRARHGDRRGSPFPRLAGHPRDRRLWPRLFLGDVGAYLHRRRQCDGAARRAAAAGHGVRAVPSDRHLWRRLS